MSDLFHLHLTLTKGEAVARLNGKWDDDVAAFDDIVTEIMTMSDALADGIIKRFPERFGGVEGQKRGRFARLFGRR